MSRTRPAPHSPRDLPEPVRRDLVTLGRFIEIFCHDHHAERPRCPVRLASHDLPALLGKSPALCEQCRKLLAHAFVKRTTCPMQPKPACKHCPDHCYRPPYRALIRQVMKHSGRKLVLRGRVHYLLKLWL